jgi:hypothetical protein
MAARFIRFTQTTGGDMFVRPEGVQAFGDGHGFPSSAWIMLWGSDHSHYIRETCQEVAQLLTNGATRDGQL